MDSVNVIVSGAEFTSPTAHFEVINGVFSGNIRVIALSPGIYTVTAFVSDATSAERTFTVSDRIAATSAVMDENAMTITGNEFKTLSVSLLPETTTDVIADIQWSSSYNGAYVSVNDGVVSINAVSKTVQTVTATVTTDAGETFICICDVTTAYGALDISPSGMSLYPGDTGEFVLTLPSGFTESSWISGNPDVASVEVSGNKGIVTAVDIGQTDITVLVGNKFKATASVNVTEKPVTVDTYKFTLKMDYDADIANYGESGYSASDLRHGIELTAIGTNAGEALESALNQAKIPCKFWTKPDNTIRYWVDEIFGFGDVKLDGGLWKYWIQYQIVDGKEVYNQKSLGFYTDGGSFILRYGITTENEQLLLDEIAKVPTPESNLTYNGKTQIGVVSGDGYTLTGNSAINAGRYTATATLNEGYVWSDGSSNPKSIEWEISPAILTVKYAGERIQYGTNPSLKLEVTGFVGGESALSLSGYTAPTIPSWTNKVGSQSLTPSGGVAPNYTFVYESGILEIYAGESEIVNDTITQNDDGSITHTIEYADGTKTETVSKTEDDGISKTETVTTTNYGSDGNPTGSAEHVTVTTTADDGTSVRTEEETIRNPDGSIQSSSKTETTHKESSENGINVTEGSVTVTEAGSEGTTVTAESYRVAESDDGSSRATESVNSEEKKDTQGNTVSRTETSIISYADSDNTVNSTANAGLADGKATYSQRIEAESADGTVRTVVEVNSKEQDVSVETRINQASSDGVIYLSKDAVQTAVAQQSKVMEQLSGVTGEKTGVIAIADSSSDVKVSMGKNALTAMSEGDASIRISSEGGSMTFGSDVITHLHDKDDISLSMSRADRSSMTQAQRDVIESGSIAISLSATAAGESIGNDLGGKVTVVVKHAAVEGRAAVAYYVSEDGTMTKVSDQSYDSEREEMTMILDHFSIYTIVDEEPSSEEGIPIIVMVAIFAALGVLIMIGAFRYVRE